MTEKQQIVVAEPQGAVPAVSESAAILQVIERAARDTTVDIDKMERLMAMHERMLARQAVAAFNDALAVMQDELPLITQRGAIVHNGKLISNYAKWEDIVDAIRPVLSTHGFALTFKIEQTADRLNTTATLRHRAGHSESTTLSLPIDMSGAKNSVQGIGSTVSYGKRYAACALLNIATTGEDDDASGADTGLISAEQKAELVDLLKQNGAVDPEGSGTKRFLQFMGVAALDEIKAIEFGRAKAALEAKRKKANAASE